MVTRNDVAKRANVSPAVVSYVINKSNYVSEKTKKAVLKAMKDLGYIPNLTARSLKKNKTFQIAILRGNALNDMFNDLLNNLEKIAYESGYTVSLITVMRDVDLYAADSFIDDLISRRFDAIFVANSSLTEEQINRMLDYDIKVLLYKTRDYEGLDPRIAYLAPDYRKGIEKLIDYMISIGHKRFLYIPNAQYPDSLSRSNHRYDGFVRALEKNGLNVKDQVFGLDFLDSSSKALEDRLKEIFIESEKPAPTVVYADESIVVSNMMKQLQELGFSVPEDVSIIGSSDSPLTRLVTPRITSMGISPEDLAQKAVNMILDLIDGKNPESYYMEMYMSKGDSVQKLIK